MDADFLLMAAQDLGRLSRNSSTAQQQRRRRSMDGPAHGAELGTTAHSGGSPFGAAAWQRSQALDCPKRPQDARRWEEQQAPSAGMPGASSSQPGASSFSVSWAMRFERSFKRHMSQ